MSFLLFVRKIRSASLSPLRARAAFAPGFFVRLRRKGQGRETLSRALQPLKRLAKLLPRLRRYNSSPSSRTNRALDTKKPSGVKEMASPSARKSRGGQRRAFSRTSSNRAPPSAPKRARQSSPAQTTGQAQVQHGELPKVPARAVLCGGISPGGSPPGPGGSKTDAPQRRSEPPARSPGTPPPASTAGCGGSLCRGGRSC